MRFLGLRGLRILISKIFKSLKIKVQTLIKVQTIKKPDEGLIPHPASSESRF
jgi:hypothetical protein